MLLEIEGICLSIGGQQILEDVQLTVGQGEIFGLVGPNGAGKSTTIAAALGLRQPDSGTINVLGEPMAANKDFLRRRLGVLPEQNGFYDWMTAEQYLSFFAELYGHAPGSAGIFEGLAAVGLEAFGSQPIGTFSRGMRQRLGLARALVGKPELLILDEPTNGLDPRGRREFHDILLALASRGAGILLCTHLLDDVERLCGRIGIIVGGRTVALGYLHDLAKQGGHQARYRLRLASRPERKLPLMPGVSIVAGQGHREGEWVAVDIDETRPTEEIWGALLEAGWPILEISRDGGGLEDLYLSLTEGIAA